MLTKEIRIIVYEYSTIYELPEDDQKLVLLARKAASKAYAPYSNFLVGCSLQLNNKEIISANNQENIAFPSGQCAERVAIFYANANYPDIPVQAIAVSAANRKGIVEIPVKPCGACRQAIAEVESRYKQPVRIILDGSKKIQVFGGVENLLPFTFKPELPD